MLGPGPGLGGSDDPHHPPSYDIKLLTLIYRSRTSDTFWNSLTSW